MARSAVVQVLINAKDATQAALRGVLGGLRRLKDAVFSLRTAFAGIISAATIKAFRDLVMRGGEVVGVQRAFTRSVGDSAAAIKQLRKASSGLIDDYDLMVGLNRALTLGSAANVQQFGELAQTAITLGRALGVDAKFALESLNLGIGRQSRLILDNLGLIVDQEGAYKRQAAALGKSVEALTEEEKRIAFRNAALEAAKRAVERLGGAAESNADKITRIEVAFKNAKDKVAEFLATSPFLNELFGRLAHFATDVAKALDGSTDDIKTLFHELGVLAANAFSLALLEGINKLIPGFMKKLFKRFMKEFGGEGTDFTTGARENIEGALNVIGALAARGEQRHAASTAGNRPGATVAAPVNPDDAATGLVAQAGNLVKKLELGRITTDEFRKQLDILAPAILKVMNAGEVTDPALIALADAFEGLRQAANDAGVTIESLNTGAGKPTFAGALRDSVVEATDALVPLQTKLGEIAGTGLVGLADAFSEAFAAMAEGEKNAAQAFGSAMLDAIAQVAAALAQLFAARAAAAFAEALLPSSVLTGQSAGGVAAGAKFLAASAAMAALAGGLHHAATSAGGGGGGGASAEANRRTEAVTDTRGEAVVEIEGDYIDTADDRQIRRLQKAFEKISDRRISVRVGRRAR